MTAYAAAAVALPAAVSFLAAVAAADLAVLQP